MIRWLLNMLAPEPALDVVPDQTGNRLGMDWWIASMGENKEIPRVGDLVIQIESCGMGMTVARDTRWRVIGPARKLGDTWAVKCRHFDPSRIDETRFLHVFYMRRHRTLRRVWTLMD